MSDGRRFTASILASVIFFCAMNIVLLRRAHDCDDCVRTYGFPFPFYMEGGFVTTRQFLWIGMAVDLVTLFAFTALLFLVWKSLSKHTLN